MDPALRQLLRSGRAAPDQILEAIIRLRWPGLAVPGVRIVSRFGTIATCRLPLSAVPWVHAHPDVVSLKAARRLRPQTGPPVAGTAEPGVAGDGCHVRYAGYVPGPLTGAGVVVGIVDWGLDVDHPNFRTDDGSTRLLALWDQRSGRGGTPPQPYGYGTVHQRAQIDEALAGPHPYRRLSYYAADADRGRGSHGTHVTDIAAGNGRAGGPIGVAPEADLVFVHLADRATGGLATLGDSVRLLEAVDFVARTAGNRPWVANLSVGQTGGPHDGTLPVERAFDELLATTTGALVVQSGGNYELAQVHASGALGQGKTRTLTFVIDPADVTPNELEIWYDGGDEFAVGIQPPGCDPTSAVRLGADAPISAGGRPVGWVYHRAHDPNNGDHHIDAFLSRWAPAGEWRVSLEAVRVTDGRFHAWIERDDACAACQPRFVPEDSDPTYTLGTIATSHLPLIVGAYDCHQPGRPAALFSSSGPTRDGRGKPDVSACGVAVLAARSAPRGSERSPGQHTVKSGTSMATPQVTGAVALCLQATGGRLDAAGIRRLILNTADPGPDRQTRDRLGQGYLDLPALAAALLAGFPDRCQRDPKDIAVNPDLDAALPLALAPSKAYRELMYRPEGQVSRLIEDRFDVLARPGQRLSERPQEGDILLQVSLGRPGAGERAVLLTAGLTRQRANGGGSAAGWYAPTTAILDPSGEVPRRILDPFGRLPHGQLLLRPRTDAEEPEEGAEPEDSPPWGGTADQIAFRDRVLQAHLARVRAARGAPQRDLADDELQVISGTDVRTARATGQAAERLVAAATADLEAAKAAGDPDALRTRRFTVVSGYRSSETQRRLWLRYFSAENGYYDSTRAARAALSDGPHSDQAVAYMLRPRREGGFGLGGRIAAPGYSNHQGGIAIDLYQERARGHAVRNQSDDASRARWRDSWFHHWLVQNAPRFGFGPLATEEWHWEYRPGIGGASPARTGAPSAGVATTTVDDAVADYLGGRLWTFTASDPGTRVAVFCPRAALGRHEVDVLLFAHGLLGGCPRPRRIPAGFVTDQPFDLGRVVDASGQAVVLVVPALDWTAPGGERVFGARHPRWHALGAPSLLNGMIAESLAEVGRVQAVSAPTLRSLIVTGHSRGYDLLEPLVHSRRDPAIAQGALARLSRIGAFDTTYSGDVDAWLDWLRMSPQLQVHLFYRPGTRTAAVGDEFYAHRRPRLTVTRVDEGHCAVPAQRLPEVLAAAPGASEDVPDDVPDNVRDDMPADIADDTPDDLPDTIPDGGPENAPDAAGEDPPEALPDVRDGGVSDA